MNSGNGLFSHYLISILFAFVLSALILLLLLGALFLPTIAG